MIAIDLPVAGPADDFTRTRLRHLITARFGHFPTLDLHLDLLDTRGTWYAERAMDSWPAAQPDAFFGVVNHVVATQMPGPAPTPDVEAWLQAGRPTDDPVLAELWDHVNSLARCGGFDAPPHDRGSTAISPETADAARALDQVLNQWPEEHLPTFLRTYVNLQIVLRRRNFVLPPIGS